MNKKRNDNLIDDGPWWQHALLELLAVAMLVVWIALLQGRW